MKENIYKLLVEKSQVPIYLMQNNKIIYLNKALSSLFGFKPDEFKKINNILSLVYKADYMMVAKGVIKILKGDRKKATLTFRARRKDGELLWVRVTASFVKYNNKPAIIGSTIDVTKEKELIEKLEKLNNKYKQFEKYIENASDAIIRVDNYGKFIYGNKKAEEISGYKREELIGKHVSYIIPKRWLFSVMKYYRELRSRKSKKIGIMEHEIYNKRKELVPVQISFRNFEYTDLKGKKRIELLGIVRDLRMIKKLRENLLESEKKYEAILNNASEIIFVHDLKGNFISINKIATDLIGYSQKEFLKMNIKQIIPTKSELKEVLQDLTKVINTGKASRSNLRILTKNKEILYFEIHGSLLKRKGKPYAIIGIAHDVSGRKKYEEKLNKKIDELQKFQEFSIGRELKMIELKKQIEKLKNKEQK